MCVFKSRRRQTRGAGVTGVQTCARPISYAHHRRGSVLWPTVAGMAPGLLLGGWLGSLVAVARDGAVLKWGVIGYCLLAAAQLMFGRVRAGGGDVVPAGPGMRDRKSTRLNSSH